MIGTSYLVLLIFLISIGVTSVYAINITLGGTVDITQILNVMGNKITNVGFSTQSSDAATKGYVDSLPIVDTLTSLGCTADQVAQFNGSFWKCKTLPSDVGLFSSIAIGTDGNPVVCYYDDTNGALKVFTNGTAVIVS